MLGPAGRRRRRGRRGEPLRRRDARRSAERARAEPDGLNPQLTFDQFVIGDGNRFAHAAALAVAEMPGQAYNPLFIYGPPGRRQDPPAALDRQLRARATARPDRPLHDRRGLHQRVRRRARTAATSTRFKARFRDIDVLLIDDVQFLERKAKTEEEFFHTFNALHDGGRQLVLTSDRLPRDLERSRTACASASRPASSPTSSRPTSPRA